MDVVLEHDGASQVAVPQKSEEVPPIIQKSVMNHFWIESPGFPHSSQIDCSRHSVDRTAKLSNWRLVDWSGKLLATMNCWVLGIIITPSFSPTWITTRITLGQMCACVIQAASLNASTSTVIRTVSANLGDT